MTIDLNSPEAKTNLIRIFDTEGRQIGRVQRLDLATNQYEQELPQVDGTVKNHVGSYARVEFTARLTGQQG